MLSKFITTFSLLIFVFAYAHSDDKKSLSPYFKKGFLKALNHINLSKEEINKIELILYGHNYIVLKNVKPPKGAKEKPKQEPLPEWKKPKPYSYYIKNGKFDVGRYKYDKLKIFQKELELRAHMVEEILELLKDEKRIKDFVSKIDKVVPVKSYY